MSKPRRNAWESINLFLILITIIFCKWPDKSYNEVPVVWILMGFFSFVCIVLVIIAIAGFCNIDIFKLLGIKNRKRTKKYSPVDISTINRPRDDFLY